MELDSYDVKLLNLLQQDAKSPQRTLADTVNLSASAVNRRISAYEQAGVIESTVALVAPAAVGRPITVIVQVTVENERLDLLDAMKARFADCRQVQQVYYVTGDFDFLLILNVKDMSEYEQLTRQMFFEPGNVKTFKTHIAMQRVKVGLAVPL